MFKQYKQVNTTNRELNLVQNYVQEAIGALPELQILNGRLEKGVVLAAASTTHVSHKLDRPIIGYFVTKKNANSQVWDTQSTNTIPDKTLQLKCSADVTVDLWVF